MSDEIYKVIRSNISESNEDLEVANTMPTNLLNLWQSNLDQLNQRLIEGLSETESPIEKIFLIEFNFVSLIQPSWIEPNNVISGLFIQHPVTVGKHQYRVDFELLIDTIDNYSLSNSPTATRIFIELDGHDFHEKTKEQVAHDKKRERDLSDKCDALLRYSGSEVYQDTSKVVKDVLTHAQNEFQTKLSASDTL